MALRIVPDEDNPHAVLSAEDAHGDTLAEIRVPPTFKLTADSAAAWIDNGYERPR